MPLKTLTVPSAGKDTEQMKPYILLEEIENVQTFEKKNSELFLIGDFINYISKKFINISH